MNQAHYGVTMELEKTPWYCRTGTRQRAMSQFEFLDPYKGWNYRVGTPQIVKRRDWLCIVVFNEIKLRSEKFDINNLLLLFLHVLMDDIIKRHLINCKYKFDHIKFLFLIIWDFSIEYPNFKLYYKNLHVGVIIIFFKEELIIGCLNHIK